MSWRVLFTILAAISWVAFPLLHCLSWRWCEGWVSCTDLHFNPFLSSWSAWHCRLRAKPSSSATRPPGKLLTWKFGAKTEPLQGNATAGRCCRTLAQQDCATAGGCHRSFGTAAFAGLSFLTSPRPTPDLFLQNSRIFFRQEERQSSYDFEGVGAEGSGGGDEYYF